MASGIYDLEGSKEKAKIYRQLLNIQVEIDTLKELLDKHGIISSLEFDAAQNYIAQSPKYKPMYDFIKATEAQIQHYQTNPQAYLRDLMNQKLQGKG